MKKIDKMRPKELYEKYILLTEKCGVEFYLKENTNFVKINCPTCDRRGKIEFYKFGFSHMRCKECHTLYVSPRPNEKQLFKYYDNYEAPNFWTELLIATNNERKYLQHPPRVKKLKNIIDKYKNEKKLFVELGAGNGNFSKAVAEVDIFKRVLATDISDKCITSCKAQGLDAKKYLIGDFKNSSIDCIVFNDLIEHVFDPYKFLKSCFKKLKQNGILMLSTPNGEGFDFKILKDKTENITSPEHLQYFNPLSIKILLKRIGFEIIEISTPGILDVEIIKRQVSQKRFNLNKNNEFLDFIFSLKNDELKITFQKFLQKNNLSSHMLVLARKNK